MRRLRLRLLARLVWLVFPWKSGRPTFDEYWQYVSHGRSRTE